MPPCSQEPLSCAHESPGLRVGGRRTHKSTGEEEDLLVNESFWWEEEGGWERVVRGRKWLKCIIHMYGIVKRYKKKRKQVKKSRSVVVAHSDMCL